MRRADLTAAGLIALFAVYLMWKSTELPIGWDPETGPGGDAYPFWISLALLLLCGVIFWRSWRGLTPHGRSSERFIAHGAVRVVTVVALSVTSMLAAVHIVGVYFAVPLFMIFYMRYLGQHTWRLTLTLSLLTPVVTFIFFEKLMLILLPKGFTERLFYIFY
jgi:putative tricarboxylic transport membrane protein